MSTDDYIELTVTPAPVVEPRTVWADIDWHDGDTLLGFDYGEVGAVPAKEMG